MTAPPHRSLPAFVVGAALLCAAAGGAAGPLAGVVLDDETGRAWRLEELDGAPVLLVVADRGAAAEANAWGARLAGPEVPLAPWRREGAVAWLAVADLRRVPEYARGATRERLREREAGRSPGERRQSSPLLLDWAGAIADRFDVDRGVVALVLLAADGRVLLQARGTVTDAAVRRMRETIAHAARR